MALPSRSRPVLVGLALDPVGHGLTASTRAALVRGVQLARRTGARLDLLHAVPGDVFVERDAAGEMQVSYHLSREGREALIEARHDAADQGVTAELYFRPERPVDALVERARATNAALILVGRTDCDSHDVGCVTRRLVVSAPCPVWVADKEEPAVIERVLVSADDVGPARLARSLARVLEAEVVDHGPAQLKSSRGLRASEWHASYLVPGAVAS